ncbi:hypothetical protein LLH23_05130 [bacterium]|nr:hypothetical protein [bacterium]
MKPTFVPMSCAQAIGPALGSCMALCVPTCSAHSHRKQPLLRAERAVLDNLDWGLARNVFLGTRYSPAVEE